MPNIARRKNGGRLARCGRDQGVGHLKSIFPRVFLYQREREMAHGFV